MKSCGCYQAEIRGQAQHQHGDSYYPNGSAKQSAEYTAWLGLKDRCLNPSNASYDNYGGRGICVAPRWLNGEDGVSGYKCFLRDMGRKPSPDHQIDRYPNNDGNYEPNNCRWALPGQQQRNRRDTIWVTVDGQRLSLADACEKIGVSYRRTRDRMWRGWTFDRAISEAVNWRGQK